MKPRVGSYGETATVTRSPRTTRMRWRRTLPASLREDLVAVVELDAKVTALRDQDDLAVEVNQLFFAHLLTSRVAGVGRGRALVHVAEWVPLTSAQEKRSGAKGDLPYRRGSPAPRATSDEIDLYIRTYYSLLRSSTDVRVRAFEEAHLLLSGSSLHLGATDESPDLAAFAYSAGRLPGVHAPDPPHRPRPEPAAVPGRRAAHRAVAGRPHPRPPPAAALGRARDARVLHRLGQRHRRPRPDR